MNKEPTIDLFAANYKNFSFLNKEDTKKQYEENLNRCKNAIETLPFFQALEKERHERFIELVNLCNLLAFHTGAEISLSVHHEYKYASVIIYKDLLDFRNKATAILAAVCSASSFISIEAVEENGLKTVLFLLFSFEDNRI